MISFVCVCSIKYSNIPYLETKKIAVVDTLHNKLVVDNYQWLENYEDPRVKRWIANQEAITRSTLDKLPQREWLIERFTELWRYDDKYIPHQAIDSERIFYREIKREWERWAYYYKENKSSAPILLLNPNEWGLKTLNFATPSRDGKYVAIGTAEAGNEQTTIKVMEVSTRKILHDSLRGWLQRGVSWVLDNSGFYYSACPLKGEVPEGEENYWRAVYFHKLGSPSSGDKKVFFDDEIKEYYHSAITTEDGKYVLFYRSMFNQNEIYLKKTDDNSPMVPIITGFDARYSIDLIDDKLLIWTDLNAPKGIVYMTEIDKPGKEHWRVLIPETDDNLKYIIGIAGHIYAVYSHNAHTLIKIYSLEGNPIRNLQLPGIGSASVQGHWSKPDVWVSFSSFTYPRTIFKYDFDNDTLELYHQPLIAVDLSNYVVEQIWYKSKDSTDVSMFLIQNRNINKDGNNPVYLTGYGGFNISQTPYFSTTYTVWLDAGGVVAIPNLRGGGEYGQLWHAAGMLANKQNVFDDFIAAAEWLIENKYTNSKKLAIGGGSNGGLLVGAATVQRPDLFKVVYCAVPLLDMIRYHKFGFANIWAEEYGSAEDPEQFEFLLKYSPYHNVLDDTKYPAIILIASENDIRCHPLHAMKMAARMQEANPDGEPILFIMQKESGHLGGTTLTQRIEQRASVWAFVMDKLGMRPECKGSK